jgi:hypothetical protein
MMLTSRYYVHAIEAQTVPTTSTKCLHESFSLNHKHHKAQVEQTHVNEVFSRLYEVQSTVRSL